MSEHSQAEPTEPMYLTVLLPAYNEEEALASVIIEVRAALAGCEFEWEILVVDDASTDQTVAIAERLAVRVVQRVENGGSGASRVTGILSAHGEVIAMLDADGSYDPQSLPEMLTYLPGFDQVNGARDREAGTLPILRIPAKWCIRKLAEWISGRTIPDLNTGLKVFKRGEMLHYLWAIPNGFSCVTSMSLAFLCNDHPVKYIPVTYRKRIGHSKFHPVLDTARYLMTVLRIIMYFRPLRIFLPLSLLLGVTALIRGGQHLVNGGWGITDSDVILAVGSLLLLALGLLADLIVRQRRFAGAVSDSLKS